MEAKRPAKRRTTKLDQARADKIKATNATPRAVEHWRKAELGPATADDEAVIDRHWETLARIMDEGSTAEEGAIELALSGFDCRRLRPLILRARDDSETPIADLTAEQRARGYTAEEAEAERLMGEVAAGSTHPGADMIRGLGSNILGPARVSEDHGYRALGALQSLVWAFLQSATGEQRTSKISTDDAHRAVGGQVDRASVTGALQRLEEVAGLQPTDALRKAVEKADTQTLAAAVRAAAGMQELFQAMGMAKPKSRRAYCAILASQAAPALLCGEALKAAVGTGQLPTLAVALDALMTLMQQKAGFIQKT